MQAHGHRLGETARSGTPASVGTPPLPPAPSTVDARRPSSTQQQQSQQDAPAADTKQQPDGTAASASAAPPLSLEDKHLALALATKGLACLLRAVDDGLSRRRMDPARHRLLRSATVLALRELVCSKLDSRAATQRQGAAAQVDGPDNQCVDLQQAVQQGSHREEQQALAAVPGPSMQVLLLPMPMVLHLPQQQLQQHTRTQPEPELQPSLKRPRICLQAAATGGLAVLPPQPCPVYYHSSG